MADIQFIHGRSAAEIAQWLHDELAGALAGKDGKVEFCVPGGSTPFPIFEELVKTDLDFSRLTVWPNDDRIVPEDHEASNTGKTRALFEPAGAEVIALEPHMDVPAFDLVWLGMGEDGHIASLFPNTDPQVDEKASIRVLTPDPLPPHAPFDRITLTLPALLRTDALMFVIRGDEKRAVFDAAAAGEHDLPVARLLGAASQRVTCFT